VLDAVFSVRCLSICLKVSTKMQTTTMTTEPATDLDTSVRNCTNYFCISDDDYIDKLRDYIFPSTFEWIIIVLYAAVFIGGLAGNLEEALVSGQKRLDGRTDPATLSRHWSVAPRRVDWPATRWSVSSSGRRSRCGL